jgi:hypothetical protein
MARFAALALFAGLLLMTTLAASTAEAAAKPGIAIGSIRVGSKSAPVVLSVQAAPNADLRLRLNGHTVKDAFSYVGRRIHVARLSTSDGVRPGENRFNVRSHGTTARRTMRVPSRALLADAGGDVGTTTTAVAQVGVRPSGPADRPGLHRRWRILDAPQGAAATLRHRHQAQPLIDATTPGTYVLELRARLRGRKSFDRATVSVSPDDPPIGAPINTLDPRTGAIVIDGESYGAGGDPADLAYVVLERTTRKVVASGHVQDTFPGLKELNDLAKKYGDPNEPRYIMVVSGREGIFGTFDLVGEFGKLVKLLGGAHLTADDFKAIREKQPFSLIGVPGGPPGSATVRVPGLGAPDASGAIVGYLQKNQAVKIDEEPVYDYVSPDHPLFDTRAPGSTATKNVMTVGGNRYEASLPANATAGLHVVMLDGLTLRPLDSAALVTNSTDPRQDSALQGGVAEWLKIRLDRYPYAIVFVQTIGRPKAASGRWAEVVGQLARLGANRLLPNYLDGTNEYSIVGRPGFAQPPIEASTAHDGPGHPHYPPARLVGALARDRTSAFTPTLPNTPTARSPDGTVNTNLIEIAYQPLQAWPTLAPGSPRDKAAAAENYICKALNFCQKTDSCPDVRSCYWQKSGSTWSQKSGVLTNLRYPGGDDFSRQTFDDVKDELGKEILAIQNLQGYFDQLEKPLDRSESRTYVNLKNIGDEVWKSTQRPVDNSTSSTLSLIGKIAQKGGAAPGSVGHAMKGIAAAFELAAFLSDKKGKPILGTEITARASELGEEVNKRITLARREIAGTEKLLFSDYGKLMAANTHVDADWSLDRDALGDTVTDMETASQQYFYEALVPAAYPFLIRLNASNARVANCDTPGLPLWPNQPDTAQMQGITGYSDNGTPIRSIFFFTRGILKESSPPGSIGDHMFQPAGGTPSGLGMEKLQFFTPRVFGGRIVRGANNKRWCALKWLPEFP